MKFNFFKRKPDPRIAELEDEIAKKNSIIELDIVTISHYARQIEMYGELAEKSYERSQYLSRQLENHKAATLSWVWDQFSDGSGDWIYLEQDDNYCIDPDSVNHKFLAYSPITGKSIADSCKKFDTQLEAKKYLETLYLKNLFLKSHENNH